MAPARPSARRSDRPSVMRACFLFVEFVCYTPTHRYIFRAESAREADGWVEDIRKCIDCWSTVGKSFDGSQSGWLCVLLVLVLLVLLLVLLVLLRVSSSGSRGGSSSASGRHCVVVVFPVVRCIALCYACVCVSAFVRVRVSMSVS